MSTTRCPPLPIDTAHAAESTFSFGHPYLKIGSRLEEYLSNLPMNEATANGADSQLPSFWPFAVLSICQYWEDLTDRQVSNAIRMRVDLKYALHLPLNYPGFDHRLLCQFRQYLLSDPANKRAFQELLNRLEEHANHPDKRRANADYVLYSLCMLNQAEAVIETMSNAMEALAARHTEWLRSIALPHWYKRYDHLITLLLFPRPLEKIKDLLGDIGRDGQYLLNAIDTSGDPNLAYLPEIQILREQWLRYFKNRHDYLDSRSFDCLSCANSLNIAAHSRR